MHNKETMPSALHSLKKEKEKEKKTVTAPHIHTCTLGSVTSLTLSTKLSDQHELLFCT